MARAVGVVGGLQALLGTADPGKSFLQALCEFLLSHDQYFQACELEEPQSLAGTTESRKPYVSGPSKCSRQPTTTALWQRWNLLAGPLIQKQHGLRLLGWHSVLWMHF